ncbi:nuclear transport factor 2 family protein [Nonomuraea sp. NPDC049695]|uniref:nuclear transport factor 2 family protein n=1 Tax=Nonomuraea sp. NPDC049695 TaxID=3154734 RepID=UPI003442E49D
MSKIFQRRGLLLAAVVPAFLVAGCAVGGNGTQAMKGEANQATPTEETTEETSPGETESPEGPESGGPEETGSEGATPTATSSGAGLPRSAVEDFFSALKSGNLDQVVSAFASTAVVELDGAPTAESTDAIRALVQKVLQGGSAKQATYTVDDVRTIGDKNAVVRSTSKAGNSTHRELFLLMKDGAEWKITELMNNKPS